MLKLGIKLISVDVDGTLTDPSGTIDTEAIYLLREIMSMGVQVFLNTGRSIWENYTLSHFLGLSKFGISENGGVIFYKHPMNVKVLGDISDAYQAYEILAKKMEGVIINQRMPRLTEILLERNIDINEANKILQEYRVNAKIVDSGYAFHLSSKQINKGYALKVLCQALGIDKNDVASIGDSEVDIPMFEASGVSFWVSKNMQILQDKGLNDKIIVTPAAGPKGVIYAIDWLIKNDKLSI